MSEMLVSENTAAKRTLLERRLPDKRKLRKGLVGEKVSLGERKTSRISVVP